MKQIGILTTSYAENGLFGCNYGAALQGYALIALLRKLGYEAYDINYASDYAYIPSQYSFLELTLRRIKLLTDFVGVKRKFNALINKSKIQIMKKKFSEFITDFDLEYEKGRFFNFNDLKSMSCRFYACITGSDVVWNPKLYQNKIEPGFYLDFADEKCRKIAYAPSFGITSIPTECVSQFVEKIEKIHWVSVREKTGAIIIKTLTGADVPVVLDPTLLLKKHDYELIMRDPKNLPGKYIAVYNFSQDEYFEKTVSSISSKIGLPIVRIPAGYANIGLTRFDTGPREFLWLINNADLVMTDSLHCTIFSLLAHTPFLTFQRESNEIGGDLNSRIIDFLSLFHHENRFISADSNFDLKNMFNIDFKESDSIIEKMRTYSIKFLKDALG